MSGVVFVFDMSFSLMFEFLEHDDEKKIRENKFLENKSY